MNFKIPQKTASLYKLVYKEINDRKIVIDFLGILCGNGRFPNP